MSAATETETPTAGLAQLETTVLYMAARRGLRLVKRPKIPVRDHLGQQTDETPGQTVIFNSDACLRVPKEGEATLAHGEKIPAEELNAWLQKHKSFGDREDGFWIVEAPVPAISKDELDAVLNLALEYDDEGLAKLIEQERNGHKRPELLQAAEGALTKLTEAKARLAASQPPPEEPKKPPRKPGD